MSVVRIAAIADSIALKNGNELPNTAALLLLSEKPLSLL
jgi:hypothetical protein